MKKAELSSVSRPEILNSIKDDKSLRIINWIAKGELSDTDDLSILLKIFTKGVLFKNVKICKDRHRNAQAKKIHAYVFRKSHL